YRNIFISNCLLTFPSSYKHNAAAAPQSDPFTRKHWFDVIAPSFAKNRFFTKICSNKDTPSKLAAESLRGRIVHVNTRLLNAKNPHTKMMGLRVGDVFGKTCVTYFNYCKNIVTKQFPKRNTTLITAFEDVKTVDGFTLRVKVCGVTGKQFKQLKATCYANNRQQRAIREMMQRVV
ncbi:MAG: ribosomal 40S subunit protein S1B, partial [Marteilia pararefringens]